MDTNDLVKAYASKAKTVQATLMRNVYSWMTLALVITGLTAMYVAKSYTLLSMIVQNQMLFWDLPFRTHPSDSVQHRYPALHRLLYLERSHPLVHLHGLYRKLHRHYILCDGRHLRRYGTLWLCDEARPDPHREHLHHGTDRAYHRLAGQPLPA